MRTLYLLFFSAIVLPCFLMLNAQERIYTLEKNKNILAKELKHFLSESKDTLVLRSRHKIRSLYTINKKNRKEIDVFINDFEYKMPLGGLSSGKHLIAVSYQQKKILIVVRVHDSNETYVARGKPGAQIASNNHLP